MKKGLFILMALVLAISVALIGCPTDQVGPTPSTKIVIGMSRSVTGPMSIIHTSAFGFIYPTYIAQVNAGGGISVPTTPTSYLVEAKVLNDNSEETKLIANANALVSDVKKGRVHTIFGPVGTHFIDVMAPIVNLGECVLMTVEGGATFLMEPGYLCEWPYVFVNLSFSNWYQLPVLGKILDEAEDNAKVYIFWQNDAHGREYLASAAKYFPPLGLQIVGNRSVADPADYATLIEDPWDLGADVVCCFCYPAEVGGLTGAAIGKDYNFDAWVTGPGGNFGWFGDGSAIGFGPAAEGVICFAVANNKTSSAMATLFNTTLACPPVPGMGPVFCQDFWGHPLYWATVQMWQEAVEAVGSDNGGTGFTIDQEALRDYLKRNKFTTVLGETYYVGTTKPNPDPYTPADWNTWPVPAASGQLMSYKCHTGEVGQWQNGYVEIIGYSGITTDLPNYVVTANVIYPKPDWP